MIVQLNQHLRHYCGNVIQYDDEKSNTASTDTTQFLHPFIPMLLHEL